MSNAKLLQEYEATESIDAEFETPKEVLGLPETSFLGSALREVWYDAKESVASDLSQQDVILTDILHETECWTLAGFRGTVYGAGKNLPDGRKLDAVIDTFEEKLFTYLEELTADICYLRGTSPETGEEKLRNAAEQMVAKRLIEPSFYGAKAEAICGDTLAAQEGVQYLAHSQKIAEATGMENPEARGIDLLLRYPDGTVVTAQVKYGPGGDMPDTCEADVLLRYEEPNRDNDLIRPVVRMYEIEG